MWQQKPTQPRSACGWERPSWSPQILGLTSPAAWFKPRCRSHSNQDLCHGKRPPCNTEVPEQLLLPRCLNHTAGEAIIAKIGVLQRFLHMVCRSHSPVLLQCSLNSAAEVKSDSGLAWLFLKKYFSLETHWTWKKGISRKSQIWIPYLYWDLCVFWNTGIFLVH